MHTSFLCRSTSWLKLAAIALPLSLACGMPSESFSDLSSDAGYNDAQTLSAVYGRSRPNPLKGTPDVPDATVTPPMPNFKTWVPDGTFHAWEEARAFCALKGMNLPSNPPVKDGAYYLTAQRRYDYGKITTLPAEDIAAITLWVCEVRT